VIPVTNPSNESLLRLEERTTVALNVITTATPHALVLTLLAPTERQANSEPALSAERNSMSSGHGLRMVVGCIVQ
jgi:hypothetical protein